MADQRSRLLAIQEKVRQLLKDRQQLQSENERLVRELEQSRKELLAYHENVESLKQQVVVLKLNSAEMSEADKQEFEKKLNKYIRDIDRCIAMLGE